MSTPKNDLRRIGMSSIEAAQARILATTPHEKVKIRLQLRPLLDAVTVLLAVASIIFAYVQKLDSRELKNKTEYLLGSVTTGYIAEFPKSIPAITKIVDGTCAELSLMVDLPGYGQYSSPDAFYSYMHSIIGLRHTTIGNNIDANRCIGKSDRHKTPEDKPEVRMFTPEHRESSLRRQLTKESIMKTLSDPTDTLGRNKIVAFLTTNRDLLRETPETFLEKLRAGEDYDEFIALHMATQHDVEQQFQKAGIEVRYARDPSIMRMWVEDAEEAAFSFDHSSETEIAFQTRDTKLLNNFKAIFEQHWANAVSYQDYWNARDKATIRAVAPK
jgi:hypothetical protein